LAFAPIEEKLGNNKSFRDAHPAAYSIIMGWHSPSRIATNMVGTNLVSAYYIARYNISEGAFASRIPTVRLLPLQTKYPRRSAYARPHLHLVHLGRILDPQPRTLSHLTPAEILLLSVSSKAPQLTRHWHTVASITRTRLGVAMNNDRDTEETKQKQKQKQRLMRIQIARCM
jgi:hypothetical protein